MFKIITLATSIALATSSFAYGAEVTDTDVTKVLGNYTSSFNALAVNTCLELPSKESFTGRTLKNAFTRETNKMIQEVNRGDHTQAAATARVYASTFGHCYGKSQNIDLAQYASGIGTFIAVDAVVSENPKKAKQALVLLDFAAINGYPDNQFMGQLEEYRDKEPEGATSANSDNLPSVTAGQISAAAKGNMLRFKRDYQNKRFAIKGKVRGVDARFGKVNVYLSDYTGNPDNAGTLDNLVCGFSESDPNADNAANLNAGEIANIVGVVKFDKINQLHVGECEIK